MLEGIVLGIDEMDAQHQMLLEIAEHFRCVSKGTEAEVQSHMASVLNALLDYATYHLAAEEEFLKAIDYPDFREHKILHHRLLSTLRKNFLLFREQCLSARQLSDFIEQWITQHILEEDAKYAAYFRKLRTEAKEGVHAGQRSPSESLA